MSRVKVIVAALLTCILLIVILQNTEPVETRFLFASIVMPRAALLALTGLVGFAVGLLMALRFGGSTKA